MNKMFIYSGDVLFCECGLPTDLKDDYENKLRTGDIVMSYTVTEDRGVASFNGLTAIVAEHYQCYQGQTPTELKNEEKGDPFVMGIKSCAINESIKKYPDGVWRVRRLKRYEDVVDGENWQDFGFNYRSKITTKEEKRSR